MNAFASGLAYVADRSLAQLIAPFREARHRKRKAPFIFRGDRGLLFELYPGEEIDRHIATSGIYERRLLRYLDHVLPAGAVMLDVGANIGNHALYLARKCAAVHCFEPNPETWRRLERNIALNGATNVTVHRYGLGDRDCVAPFRTNREGNLGASGFVAMGRPAETGSDLLELPIRDADRVIDELQLGRLDLIKIDVEGMEPQVLHALRRSIARYRPLVTFEYSGHLSGDEEWRTVRASLPGYTILAPRPAGESRKIGKMLQLIRRGGFPEFAEVREPEPRWHECLIAFPVPR